MASDTRASSAFAAASPWAEEIAVYCMIFAVYLGATLAVRERQHIRITLLIEHAPRPLAVALVVLADLLWAGFALLMVDLTLEYVGLLFRIGQVYWSWKRNSWMGLPL